ETKMEKPEKYQKKYTNADYYKEGKFQAEVALNAVLDMFDYYGIPYTEYLKKNMFITDFELGDFENVGMAGVFFVNDSTYRYFGHDIYLLPGQMIAEHYHLPTANFPAKHESWLLRHGNCASFGIGEPTANNFAIPASQKDFVTVADHSQEIELGNWVPLAQLESRHFLLAGDQGAIVTEFGTYHDNAGLNFTNPKVVFTDILTELRNK
ncbi:MAG: hypothetical protein RR034_08750, partial [Bacteroidales bacterium]